MLVQTIIKYQDTAIVQIAIIERREESVTTNATYTTGTKFTRARYSNEDKLISQRNEQHAPSVILLAPEDSFLEIVRTGNREAERENEIMRRRETGTTAKQLMASHKNRLSWRDPRRAVENGD